jgi:hypothetical protein
MGDSILLSANILRYGTGTYCQEIQNMSLLTVVLGSWDPMLDTLLEELTVYRG